MTIRSASYALFMALFAAAGCHRAQLSGLPAAGFSSPGAAATAVQPGAYDAKQEQERLAQSWPRRDERGQLEQSIEALERLVVLHPDDAAAAAQLSRAYFMYGQVHLPGDAQRQARQASFARGMLFGEHGLRASNPALAEQLVANEAIEAHVELLSAADVPAATWYVANLGAFARQKGVTTLLFYRERLVCLVERLVALDETYFYGAPKLFHAIFLARAPGFAGGNLEAAKKEFEQLMDFAPNFFPNPRAFAQSYALAKKDRPLFVRLLQQVVAGDPQLLPDVAPELRLEQAEAKQLLARVEELF